MPDERSPLPYVNCLESWNLIDTFLRHPPQGFTSDISESGVPLFFTRYPLLTTLDAPVRRRLLRLPGARCWQRWLSVTTCFAGTTASEYAIFPKSTTPTEILSSLKRAAAGQRLLVIKDLPDNSPLLPDGDNHAAQVLYNEAIRQDFIALRGQALAWVPIDFSDIDAYLARLSHSRRRNLRRKLRSRDQLRIEVLLTGDVRLRDRQWQQQLYQLYLAVYQQSEIHFDQLTPDFFSALLTDADSGGRLFLYWHGETLAGYNLCYQNGEMLIDKYIGLRYPLAQTLNLYFVSWFVNLQYALDQGLRCYVAGWTDPEVKASLGARFTFTRHLVWVRNPLLRWLITRCRHLLESDARWQPEEHS